MEKTSNNNIAIKYGLFSGVVIILYHLGVYFGIKEWIITPAFYFSIYIIHIIFMICAGLIVRSQNGGLLDFKGALREAFLTFIIGAIIYFIVYYVLFNFDAELIALQKQSALELINWQLEQQFIDEDIYEAMKKAWEADDHKVSFWDVITGIPFRLMGGFLLSLLVAAIVKR